MTPPAPLSPPSGAWTLIAGCLAGTGYLVIMADVADTAHSPLTQGTVRVGLLPAVPALAFDLRTPFRPVTQGTPVPACIAAASHLVLAALLRRPRWP